MRVENHDFFYFDPEFSGQGDFADDAVFTPEQKKDFLEHYSEFCRKSYYLPERSLKACPEAEAKELDTLVSVPVSSPKISKRIDFTHMDAALVKKQYAYQNWSLHTARTGVSDGAVVFGGTAIQPSPSAELKLDGGRVRELQLSLYFGKEYAGGGIDSGYSCNDPHRLISLNDGVVELFIITVHPNGKVSLGVTSESRYFPELNFIGDVRWNCWQDLKITFTDYTLTVSFGGSEPKTLKLASYNEIDRLCISSGTNHRGEWKVKPLKIATDKYEITEFFKPAEEREENTETLGEVKIPFSVGNIANADKMLVFTKEFLAEAGKKAVLTIGSIDPGGRAYLDGELIADVDNFEQVEIDVTELISKKKKHTLKIEVDPRGAEIPCRRHSNCDPYNGWFCEEVCLDIINEIEITNARIITHFAEDKKAKANFSCKTSMPCKINIYIAPSWPAKGEERILGTFDSDGAVFADIDLENINLWSAATPELYDIRFEAVNPAGIVVDDTVVETGFCTIDRRNGEIYVNGKKTQILGAVTMQYLPPYTETSTTHICPRDWQIVWQYLMLKRMQGNSMLLNILGYGTNDVRFARLADRLGVMLFWTTRYIDSPEQGVWEQRDGYTRQIALRLNHPSIIREGFSELMRGMLQSDERACLIGRQDPNTKEAKEIYFNPTSYEVANESALGFTLTPDDWRISQAYQALSVSYNVRRYRVGDGEGMTGYCLLGGGNDGGYMKPIIDMYGYAKYAYYVMKENYKKVTCVNDTTDIKRGRGFTVNPVLLGEKGETYSVTVAVIDEKGNPVEIKTYGDIDVEEEITRLPEWTPEISEKGYYAVKTIVLKTY